VAVARFFAAERLPLVTADLGILRRTTLDTMDVPDGAF